MEFLGYRRADGRIGIRNHILIVPTVSCVNRVAADIASKTGAATLTHPMDAPSTPKRIAPQRRLSSVSDGDPNVAAVLVVGLGCETASAKRVTEAIRDAGIPVETMVVQQKGGSRTTSDAGVHAIREMQAKFVRPPADRGDISELVIALECGSSNPSPG